AEIDVAGDRATLRPLEVDLCDLVVFENGDALLAGIHRHEQLALRLGQRRPARLAAARLAGGPLARLPLRRLLPLHARGDRGSICGRGRTLPVAAAARTTTTLLRCGAGFSVGAAGLGGHVDGQ